MKFIFYIVLTLLLSALYSCEEKIEDLGDPKGIIEGNTTTFHKTIYANYDSVVQIDSSYSISGARTAFGHHNDVRILVMLRFFKFFPIDSLVEMKGARLILTTDYVVGDHPSTIPLKFYEFEQPWTTETLESLVKDHPDDAFDEIFNMTGGVVVAEKDYSYDQPDTLDNSRLENDTISVDIDPLLALKWAEDPDWDLKGLLLYPDFSENVMMQFFPFGTNDRISFRLTYDYYNVELDSVIAVQDSIFPVSTDVSFFEGDFPEAISQTSFKFSTGRIQRLFVNFDYGELPKGAIVLFAQPVFPIDKHDSFFSIGRSAIAMDLIPLIRDENGELILPSFLTAYSLGDINEDYSVWQLPAVVGGLFATGVLQPMYNGISVDPDSLYIKGYWLQMGGFMDDYSFYTIHGPNSIQKDLIPRIEIEYFIPPAPRY